MQAFLAAAVLAAVLPVAAAAPRQAPARLAESPACDPKLAFRVLVKGLGEPDELVEPRLSACKVLPYGNREVLAAVVADSAEEGTVDLVLGVVDATSGKVLATLRDQVTEDADFRFDTDSLRWDTANYQLAPDIRAFGLDVRSGYIPNCADAQDGARRTLYVWQGGQLRAISPPLPLYRAVYVVRASGTRCSTPSDEPVKPVTEVFTTVVEIAPTADNGWRDLSLRVTRRELESASRTNAQRTATLRYDGQQYRYVPAQPEGFALDLLFEH